jgi:hypothetical protein
LWQRNSIKLERSRVYILELRIAQVVQLPSAIQDMPRVAVTQRPERRMWRVAMNHYERRRTSESIDETHR